MEINGVFTCFTCFSISYKAKIYLVKDFLIVFVDKEVLFSRKNSS